MLGFDVLEEYRIFRGSAKRHGASEDLAFMRGRAQKGQVIINIGA